MRLDYITVYCLLYTVNCKGRMIFVIKIIQRLRRKKGFTLVELIAVVAIIGVLGTILVPTLLGAVEKARLTSVNHAAANIQKSVTAFFVQADASNYGMKLTKVQKFEINVTTNDNVTTWKCSAADVDNFLVLAETTIKWGSVGTYKAEDSIEGVNGETLLCASLQNSYPNLRKASIVIYLIGGKCTYSVYTIDLDGAIATSEYPQTTTGIAPDTFEWNGKTAGISPGGIIIGTAPIVPMK